MTLLKVQGLHSGYTKLPVVHGVDLHVEPEEIVALVGVNGAGKTCLLKTLAGLLPPVEGSVHFDGTDLSTVTTKDLAKLGFGYVPQGANTFAALNVEANLRVALTAVKQDVGEGLRFAAELFPVLGDRMKQTASTLSGGERQMLALASAMVTRPRMLALDEPTVGLAPSIVQDLVTRICQARDRGSSILWVIEENPFQILEQCDRVYVMQGGTITNEMPAERLLADNTLQELFFGASANPPTSTTTR